MASQFDRSDWGIVFYGSTASPLPTYTDVRGQENEARLLSVGSEVVMDPSILSAYFHVGGKNAFTFQVDVTTDGELDLDLTLKGKVNDGAGYGSLITVRNDDGATQAVQTFTADGSYILQTANLTAIAEALIAATLNSLEEDATAEVVVRLRVE